ncbi:MAG: nucleotidyltransferase family protein [Candidatus Micrarchaeota archaeon]|nr:nucleotidyltransferase family protein [Candidatus Micrarchaeota archaeon]
MLKTAVIIAGGEGSRLAPLTVDRPKTLVEVNGKPILYWVLRWLKKGGIKNVVIGVAYKKDKIFDYMNANQNFGFNVKFSEHTLEGGTAQAFKLAITRHVKDDDFLAMNADELTNLDISKLYQTHREKEGTVATLSLAPFYSKFSVVTFDEDKTATGFTYGARVKDVFVSDGIYIFSSKILDYLPDTGSIETAVFHKLAGTGKIRVHQMADGEEWYSINTIKELKEVESMKPKWLMD